MAKSKREKRDCGNHEECESKIVDEKLLSHTDKGLEIVKEMKNGKLALGRELT